VNVRRVLVGLLVATSPMLVAPTTASASCVVVPSVEGGLALADVVFVGTVVELDNHGRYATFAVDELWKGSVDAEVEVRGGPPDPPGADNGSFVVSSIERRYELGTRYLVTAFEGDQHTGDEGGLSDNNCSGTAEWSEELAQFRPVDAIMMTPDGSDAPPYVLIALTTVFVAGGCLYLLFRRGSLAYRARQDEETTSG